jgi:hypothetical protein
VLDYSVFIGWEAVPRGEVPPAGIDKNYPG